jgi:hypothetical protein
VRCHYYSASTSVAACLYERTSVLISATVTVRCFGIYGLCEMGMGLRPEVLQRWGQGVDSTTPSASGCSILTRLVVPNPSWPEQEGSCDKVGGQVTGESPPCQVDGCTGASLATHCALIAQTALSDGRLCAAIDSHLLGDCRLDRPEGR